MLPYICGNMNDTIKNFLIAAGLYFLVTTAVGNSVSNYIEGLNYRLKKARVKLQPSSILNVLITVPVEIENTNNTGVTLQNFQGQLYYQGAALSALFVPVITLSAQTVNTIELTAIVNVLTFGTNVVALITAGNFSDEIEIKGVLNTSLVNIPIDQKIGLISTIL